MTAASALAAILVQGPPSVESAAQAEWSFTPDVLLFIAAAVMTVGVIAFGIWLFMRAAHEERRA